MKKNVFFVAAIFAALCLNSCDKIVGTVIGRQLQASLSL